MVRKVTNKTFEYVGVSNEKLIFSNNLIASKQYHRDMTCVTRLPDAMTKLQAVAYVMTLPLYQNREAINAIHEFQCSDCVAFTTGTHKKTASDVASIKQLKIIAERV
jgi:hypothetical protein